MVLSIVRRRPMLLALALAAVLGAPALAAAQAPSRLAIAIPADDGSLTPYTFESGYAFMSLIYDTLLWRDTRGVARPWLARAVTRSADGRIVRVDLRPGVRWHDGRRLTAADVAFTYRFMAQRSHPRFTPQLQDIERVETDGELGVLFRLRRPSLAFEDQPLADVPILPRHLWAGLERDRRAPPGRAIGSGPYRLSSYEPGRRYRLRASRGYFRGTPSVARIDVPVIRRQDAIFDQLRRRRVDVVPVAVPPGLTPEILPGVRLAREPSYTGTMLVFNVRRRPFDRLVARRAVARALDLDAIAGNATGAPGGVVPADRGIVHPRSRWARAGVLHRYEPSAARLAFAEQGISAFRVAAPRNDPVRLAAATRVVRALTDAGARAELLELSPSDLDRALGRSGAPASFDVAVLGIPALASYDPAFLRAIFGDPRTASLNDGGYRSRAFDDLADSAVAAGTERERRELVNDELRLLARELPVVPLLFGGGTFAYRPMAYDGWVSIRGSGIVDKRSFLRAGAAQPTNGAGTDPAAGPGDLIDSSDDDGFSLVPIIIAFVVLALAGAAWWLRQRRT